MNEIEIEIERGIVRKVSQAHQCSSDIPRTGRRRQRKALNRLKWASVLTEDMLVSCLKLAQLKGAII